MAVEPGSPAEKAGLQRGDVITQVNGQEARDARTVRNRLGLIRAGQQVQLTYARGDRTQTVTAELAPVQAQPRVRPAANQR
jgi:S1-C subfamily serine protease